MPEQELFEKFLNKLQFDVAEYLDSSQLSDSQNKLIDDATFIFKDNIIGEIKKFGGNLDKNKDKLENFQKKADEELENEQFKESAKELKQLFKDYVKKLRDFIAKTCVAVIPVKEMPWIDVIFRSVPRLIIENKKVNLLDNAIAYYGEIKCVISRTTIYGKMKDADPLFAPFIGELDLGSYKLDDTDKSAKSLIYSYVSAIIESLDSSTTRSQLAKYHEGYQRHGEPICDFLMNNKDLLAAMDKVKSGLDLSRIKSDIAISGIALPLNEDNTSLILVTDEGSDSGKFSRCFEGLLRFSAAGCESPSTTKAGSQAQPQTGSLRTPGGLELKEWTAEELASAAQQRGGGLPPGTESWTAEDLEKFAEERSEGIPEGMEVWTEDELQELSRKRQGGLDIPEWKPDKGLLECSKCGYSLRKGWSECPICGTPAGSEPTPPSSQEVEPEEKEITDKKDNSDDVNKKSEMHDSKENED